MSKEAKSLLDVFQSIEDLTPEARRLVVMACAGLAAPDPTLIQGALTDVDFRVRTSAAAALTSLFTSLPVAQHKMILDDVCKTLSVFHDEGSGWPLVKE